MKSENRYDSLIQFYAEESNVDWLLLKAQIKAESNFNSAAISKCGAKGLAQFMPGTWKEWGIGSEFDSENSIAAQTKYMLHLLRRYSYNKVYALAAYNWGLGNVDKVLKKKDKNNFEKYLPRETRMYIQRILQFYKQYKEKGK